MYYPIKPKYYLFEVSQIYAYFVVTPCVFDLKFSVHDMTNLIIAGQGCYNRRYTPTLLKEKQIPTVYRK